MARSISFFQKFAACIMLTLLVINMVLLLGTPPRPTWISETFIFGCSAICLIIPFAVLPVWRFREKRKLTDTSLIFCRINTWISYLTGFCISLFGWKKLFHLQFRIPLSIADLPMSGQTGETLTWYYFGHSYIFVCIIAIIQIFGSFLLYFRKTTFAGALLLFPVMLNIMLINIFYQMNSGALLQSILLTLGLLYIILLQYPILISLLFPAKTSMVDHSRKKQWIMAGIVSLISFLFILNTSHLLPCKSALYGCYEVQDMSVNGKRLSIDTGTNQDSILTKVYFDLDNVCVLEYNNQNRRLISNYTFDNTLSTSDSKMISCRFVNKGKEVFLTAGISAAGERRLLLKGSLSGDQIEMNLLKLK